MVDAPSLPPHLIIDGNNLLCAKPRELDASGRRRRQTTEPEPGSRLALRKAPLDVRENAHWFRELKHWVSEPTSAADFYHNLKVPNLRLLNNLLCYVAAQTGWTCTLFTDTSFVPMIQAADRRSPEMGYAALWAEMYKVWGPTGRNWIEPPPERSGDGSKGQADHHLLAAARLYSATHDVLIVSNDKFMGQGEAERYPDLFPPGDQRGRILVTFKLGANDTAEFVFPEPYPNEFLRVYEDEARRPAPNTIPAQPLAPATDPPPRQERPKPISRCRRLNCRRCREMACRCVPCPSM